MLSHSASEACVHALRPAVQRPAPPAKTPSVTTPLVWFCLLIATSRGTGFFASHSGRIVVLAFTSNLLFGAQADQVSMHVMHSCAMQRSAETARG